MNQLRAIAAAFLQQWKVSVSNIGSMAQVLGIIPPAIVVAWVARQSNDPAVLTYVSVGVPLMAIWNGVIFNVGWSLNRELSSGTLGFVIISRTQMMTVLIGKTLAQIAISTPVAVIGLVIMLLVSFQVPLVAEIGLLVFSLLLMAIALVVTSLLFAPLTVLVGGRGGFFNAIMPFGVVLSGFYFPIDRLPVALQVIARILPTSWAMNGVWQSIQGVESWGLIVSTWGMCLITSAAVFGITYLLFQIVEKRIRTTGSLVTF
jgi:ABC-type multidrug transport system permease subunit